ncbi:putative regulatory protein [Actinokineospora spheciospongiae]|uniref:Putative regulatory protein n=1 Tax=Actinokineospora spheciospongiae TaxID=909613 RepID=W7IQZ1_9PSEU|nr:AfsR/SARP family transcriptional regulator [Actinokineospora spheciospongiae]EWC63330.1 putative regulatory protein [Actinokineospora spheciospongiae]
MTRFMMLGPLAVVTADRTITPTAPMLRRTLALLLLNVNSVVSFGTLVEELWDENPPRSAKTTLQTYIYQWRKLLGSSATPAQSAAVAGGFPGTALLTRQAGYELRLGPDDVVDVDQFESAVRRAKAKHGDGLVEDASTALRSALALWRGAILDDTEIGPVLGASVTRLAEARQEALELRLDLDLQLGRHRELVSELSSLVREHPGHEGFVNKLMVALVRAGRRSDALDVYRRARVEMVEGLGLEPSTETQRLHEAILTGEVDLTPRGSATAASARPAQIPPAGSHFVGRGREYRQLQATVADPGQHDGWSAGGGMRVVEIVGAPGVGKTAFVTHVGHRLRSLFPDGQLYASPGATDDRGIAEILAGFLEGAGVPPQQQPTRLTALISMFRTWTADRKVLVVLDDVVSSSHARMLAPSGAGCALLLTSRIPLGAVQATSTVVLPPLTEQQAVDLLARRLGEQRVAAEPVAARLLAQMCERLPVLLHAAAGKLAAQPEWSMARLAERLTSAEDVLAELGAGGAAFLVNVDSTYRELPAVARAAFDFLARRPTRAVTAEVISAEFEVPATTAKSALEKLAEAYLIEVCPPALDCHHACGDTYRISPLMSLVAKRLATTSHAAGSGGAQPHRLRALV